MRYLRLLDIDANLANALEPTRFRQARECTVAPAVRLPRGRWSPKRLAVMRNEPLIGLFVVSAVLLRSVSLDGRPGAELVGPGDFIGATFGDGTELSVPETATWTVLQPGVVACLDGLLPACLARWPELGVSLLERADTRARMMAFQLALTQLRRVDERVLLLLWRLADRWGRVTPEGVQLPIRLTHEAIAGLVGAKRPTVTSALLQLRGAGKRRPRSRSRWLLLGEPPAQRTLRPSVGTALTAGGKPALDVA